MGNTLFRCILYVFNQCCFLYNISYIVHRVRIKYDISIFNVLIKSSKVFRYVKFLKSIIHHHSVVPHSNSITITSAAFFFFFQSFSLVSLTKTQQNTLSFCWNVFYKNIMRKLKIRKRTRPRKRPIKKGKTFFFSWSLSWSSSCFLVFLLSWFFFIFNSHLTTL